MSADDGNKERNREIARNEELLEERLLAVVRDTPRAAAPIGR